MIRLIKGPEQGDEDLGGYLYYVEKDGEIIGSIKIFRNRDQHLEIDFMDRQFSIRDTNGIYRALQQL